MKKLVFPALVAINVLLMLVLVAMWIAPNGQWRNLRWQPADAQTTDFAAMLPKLTAAPPINTGRFVAMLERPLFTMTRRPPPPPPPPSKAGGAATDSLGSAKLTGLFTGGGDGGVILNLAGKDRRVRIREQIEGWTLTAVDERSATFSNGANTQTLQLKRGQVTTFTGQLPSTSAPASPAAAVQRPAAIPNPPAQQEASPKPSRPVPVFGGSIGG